MARRGEAAARCKQHPGRQTRPGRRGVARMSTLRVAQRRRVRFSSPLLSSPLLHLRCGCPSGGVCTSRPSHEAVAARGLEPPAAPGSPPSPAWGSKLAPRGSDPPEGNLRTAGGCLGRVEEGDASRGVRRVGGFGSPAVASSRRHPGYISATSRRYLGDISARSRPDLG